MEVELPDARHVADHVAGYHVVGERLCFRLCCDGNVQRRFCAHPDGRWTCGDNASDLIGQQNEKERAINAHPRGDL